MPPPTNDSAAPSATTYDLVLLLDTQAPQEARAGVLKDVKKSISSDGELVRHDQWGNRELAYPIRHREQAEYHLLQFHPAKAELLHGLDRSLRIADEVLRFRIVKLRPGTPAPPDMRSGQLSGDAERASPREGDVVAETPAAESHEAEPAAEPAERDAEPAPVPNSDTSAAAEPEGPGDGAPAPENA